MKKKAFSLPGPRTMFYEYDEAHSLNPRYMPSRLARCRAFQGTLRSKSGRTVDRRRFILSPLRSDGHSSLFHISPMLQTGMVNHFTDTVYKRWGAPSSSCHHTYHHQRRKKEAANSLRRNGARSSDVFPHLPHVW